MNPHNSDPRCVRVNCGAIAYKTCLSLYILLSTWTSLVFCKNTKNPFNLLWMFETQGVYGLSKTTLWMTAPVLTHPTPRTFPHVCLPGLSLYSTLQHLLITYNPGTFLLLLVQTVVVELFPYLHCLTVSTLNSLRTGDKVVCSPCKLYAFRK